MCFLAKASLIRPKTTYACLTGNLAVISPFDHSQISERYEQVSLFFFFRDSFIQNYPFLHQDLLVECLQVVDAQLRNPPV